MIFCIYGSGGLGREIFDVAVRRSAVSRDWEKIIFVDDFAEEGPFYGTERISFASLQALGSNAECVIGVGEPSARESLSNKLHSHGIALAVLSDPSAIVCPSAHLGAGTVVMERCIVKANVEVGANVLLQPFSNIGHDIIIGAHSVISPFCAPGGGTVFGQRVFVGMHVSVLEGLTVGDDAIIGMGSAVFRDVPAGATVLGNPARVTKGNDEGKVFR